MYFKLLTILLFSVLIHLVNGSSEQAFERAFTRRQKVPFKDGQCVTKEFGKIKPGGHGNNDQECKQAFCHPPNEYNDDAHIDINDCVGSITCGVTKRGPGHFPDCCPRNDPEYCSDLTIVPLK